MIVLHQRGSHGPAYHTDVPQWAKEFFPECDLPNLRNCDRAAINNSYDNTILYTDYFVSRVIDELDKRSTEFDTAMLYVSDHGESLGENGLYLHGLPYSMAPREQTEVPMLFWASPELLRRARERRSAMLAPLCAARHEPRRDLSHALADLRPRVAALRRTARPAGRMPRGQAHGGQRPLSSARASSDLLRLLSQPRRTARPAVPGPGTRRRARSR